MSFFIEKSGQKFLQINDDPDLRPIDIPMVAPPAFNRIENHHLRAENQFFQYQRIPDKLMNFVAADKEDDDSGTTLKEIHKTIRENHREFKEEIAWLKYHGPSAGNSGYLFGLALRSTSEMNSTS